MIAAIDLPRLFDSQLIVFFGQDYSRFFTRETSDQRWVALPPHRSLERDWSLRIPAGFSEWGFSETRDEDFERRGETTLRAGADDYYPSRQSPSAGFECG